MKRIYILKCTDVRDCHFLRLIFKLLFAMVPLICCVGDDEKHGHITLIRLESSILILYYNRLHQTNWSNKVKIQILN